MRRALSAFFLAVFCYSFLAVPYAEASLWKERRAAVESAKKDTLVAQLPRVRPAAFPNISSSLGEQPSVLDSLPLAAASHIPLTSLKLPLAYSNFKSAHFPASWKPSDLTVINIQDVHMNAEAQTNISKSLQELIDQGKVDMVALEGAFTDVDVSGFRTFEDQESVRMVTDYFLKDNKLSGAIHAALTLTPHPDPLHYVEREKYPPFVGVDDKFLHTAHIQAYKDSVGKAEGLKKELSNEEAVLEQKKPQVYNPALLAFDKQVTAYRKGTLPLGEYVKSLSALSNLESRFSNLSQFLKALAMEQSLDFKQVEAERGKMVQFIPPISHGILAAYCRIFEASLHLLSFGCGGCPFCKGSSAGSYFD
ncbi:MAG: hypothetical protein A2901_01200 [Elusimicrobia bacterium RIFCSPLOWO2_01_FULL_54_10]|nr:MAG: hypothetical protein A2901_01200 [Elusimicrobia bacterium RIFCSPLOWO2_01_FULL_54_10]